MIPRLKIGTNNFLPVHIKDKDRYLGVFVIGKTGVGKSNLLEVFWSQDCLFNTAKILIEPSGTFAPKAYSITNGNSHYCSIDNPVSINPLTAKFRPSQIVDVVIELINQVVNLTTDNQRLTVKMRSLLTKATLWCLKNNRKRFDAIRDVLASWKGDNETRDGIISRLDLLLNDEALKKIVCGERSINWQKFIDNRETFILDCHGMSKDKMVFVGSIVTHSLKSYLRYTRKDIYKPCIIYVDEAHNFISPNWLDLLKEGRKYKLSAILATQDFANLDSKLSRTILSNIGTLLSFRAGYAEASKITKEFPTITTDQLLTLEKYHVAYRTPDDEGISKTSKALPVKRLVVPKDVPHFRKDLNIKPKWFPLEPLSGRIST